MTSDQPAEPVQSEESSRLPWLWKAITWGVSLLLVLAIIVLVVVAARLDMADPVVGERRLTNVEVQTVEARDYRETLVLPGRLLADRSAAVAAELPARLREWRGEEGGRVEEGQVVAGLEDDDLRSSLAELEAGLPGARSAEAFARRELARIRELAAAEVAPASELERAENALAQAESGLAQLENRIRGVEVRLAKLQLRAPIGGRLERHLAEPGEWVAVGTPVARIFDFRRVRVKVDVPDRYIPFFDHENEAVRAYLATAMPGAEPHLAAQVELPGMPKLTGGTYDGLRLPAEIFRLAQAADPRSNTFEVTLRLDNPAEALREGMIVRAHLEFLRYSQALVLPVRAVQMSEVGPRVLVVEQREGRQFAAVRDIEPISVRGDDLLIGGGVEVGDWLLTVGGRGVIDGEEVRVLAVDGEPVAVEDYDLDGQAAKRPPGD